MKKATVFELKLTANDKFDHPWKLILERYRQEAITF